MGAVDGDRPRHRRSRWRTPGRRWGAHLHFNTKLTEFLGSMDGPRGRDLRRGDRLPTSPSSAPRRRPTPGSPRPPGVKTGSAGGIIVDERMRTSIRQTSGPRATASRSRTASRTSRSRACPAATPTPRARSRASTPRVGGASTSRSTSLGDGGRQVDIGGVSFSETLATALGIPHVVG